MKTGKSLPELAREIERQAGSKRDFKAPTTMLTIVAGEKREPPISLAFGMTIEGQAMYPITDTMHKQLGAWTGIPGKYYDAMFEAAPSLLAANVNHWLHARRAVRLVRTLDGRARAFLSDRYRPIDNDGVAMTVLPLLARNEAEVISSEITETRMYIKAVFPKVQHEVKKGDVVEAGIVVSNSEVGMGAVKIEPLLYRLICLNGAIASDAGLKRYHIGRVGNGDLDEAFEVYQTDTMQADSRAFFLKVRDAVNVSFDEARFRQLAEAASASTERALPEIAGAVTAVSKAYSFRDKDGESVLKYLVNGGDLTQWGLANAVTRYSQDVESYDRATELERAGGDLMLLDPSGWERLVGRPSDRKN